MTEPNVPDEPDFEILEIIDLSDTGPQAPQVRPPRPAVPAVGAPTARPEAQRSPMRDREDARRAGAREVLRELLAPLDALESCVREDLEPEALQRAVRLALRALWNVFRPWELERIEGDGMPFDPAVHEAAEITPSARVPANTVLETLRVGYRLGGELVRPALVRVSAEAPHGSETP